MEKIIYKGIVFTKPDYDERQINRGKTATAIKKGWIKRQHCEICGDVNFMSDAHHEKYADYLNVRWLCKPHHKTIHNIFNQASCYEHNIKISEDNLVVHPKHYTWAYELKINKEKLAQIIKEYGFKDISK